MRILMLFRNIMNDTRREKRKEKKEKRREKKEEETYSSSTSRYLTSGEPAGRIMIVLRRRC